MDRGDPLLWVLATGNGKPYPLGPPRPGLSRLNSAALNLYLQADPMGGGVVAGRCKPEGSVCPHVLKMCPQMCPRVSPCAPMCPQKVAHFRGPQWTVKTDFQSKNKKIRTVLDVCRFKSGAPDRNRTCITPLGGESSVH